LADGFAFSEAKLSAAHPELLLIASMFHHY
jgi:hypothetical protein